jgi:hypothetical protein
MKFSLIAPGQVSMMVPALLPYLRQSEQWTRGRAKVDDILRMILIGQMGLWALYDDQVVYGHVVTEIKQYPQCKMLTIQYCAAKPNYMEHLDDLVAETMDRFARDAGCAGIEFVGRPGWRKAAKKYDFQVQSVMYQKFFEEAT